MFEIFTQLARTAILEAQAEARVRHDPYVGCEHLLVGLLREGTGLAATILVGRSITLDAVRAAVDELLGPAPTTVPPDEALASIGIDLGQVRARLEATFGPDALAEQPVPFDPAVKEALQAAVAEAGLLHQRHVGTEHELLGLLQVTEGAAAKILQQLAVDLVDLSIEVRGRAAPEEQRVHILLAQWQSLDRTITDAPEGNR
jgi:ATP-dependent Clp protease ATP-binding subunit ClpA